MNYRRLLGRQLPDIRYKRFVRIFVGKKWRYFKSFNNALRSIDTPLYEWLCVNEPGFSPLEVLQVMKIKTELLKRGEGDD